LTSAAVPVTAGTSRGPRSTALAATRASFILDSTRASIDAAIDGI
jgi:hypothetical protein